MPGPALPSPRLDTCRTHHLAPFLGLGGLELRLPFQGGHPFIASQTTSSIRPITDAVFLQKRLTVPAALDYPSVAACGALVAAGLGITALPRLALELVDMRALAAVPLQRPTVARPIGIVTRIGRSLPPVSRAFMEVLVTPP